MCRTSRFGQVQAPKVRGLRRQRKEGRSAVVRLGFSLWPFSVN